MSHRKINNRRDFNTLISLSYGTYIGNEFAKGKQEIIDDAEAITMAKFLFDLLLNEEDEYIEPLYPYATPSLFTDLLQFEHDTFEDDMIELSLDAFDDLVETFAEHKENEEESSL